MFYYNLTISIFSILFWLYLIYALIEIYHKRAPFVPAIGKHKTIAIQYISPLLSNKNKLTIIDAGCGNGDILALLAKQYPHHHFIGIEYNKTLFNYCKKHWQQIPNLSFIHQDLLKFDYSNIDIIYYFGIPSLTKQLENIILNTNKNIDIISIEEEFPNLYLNHKTPFKILNNTSYVYHFKNYLAK